MAFNYNMSQNGNNSNAFLGQQQTVAPQQNIQPLFPQPQGNVYNINSTLEVANVPVSAGMSVALCLNEGIMYIKSMQNGNPLFWAYKITPYDNSEPQKKEDMQLNSNVIEEQFKKYNEKFTTMEGQINDIQKTLKTQGGLPI